MVDLFFEMRDRQAVDKVEERERLLRVMVGRPEGPDRF